MDELPAKQILEFVNAVNAGFEPRKPLLARSSSNGEMSTSL